MIKHIKRKKNAFDGIPDSLTLSCSVCGEIPNICYHIDDHIWEKIVPKPFRRGIICLGCFDKLCEERGIDMTEYISRIYIFGHKKTMLVNIQKVYHR